jgi:hypothetical protein
MTETLSSSDASRTWDGRKHPQVIGAFDESGGDWCDCLEQAPNDVVVGKILCVCVAMAIAREVLLAEMGHAENLRKAAEPLDLLNEWVNCPTDARFERICALIFDEKHLLPDDRDPNGVVWWTLRVATSSVGNYEAGWALKSLCSAAGKACFSDNTLRAIAKRELLSRLHRA